MVDSVNGTIPRRNGGLDGNQTLYRQDYNILGLAAS